MEALIPHVFSRVCRIELRKAGSILDRFRPDVLVSQVKQKYTIVIFLHQHFEIRIFIFKPAVFISDAFVLNERIVRFIEESRDIRGPFGLFLGYVLRQVLLCIFNISQGKNRFIQSLCFGSLPFSLCQRRIQSRINSFLCLGILFKSIFLLDPVDDSILAQLVAGVFFQPYFEA